MSRNSRRNYGNDRFRASLIFVLLIAITSPYTLLPFRVSAETRGKLPKVKDRDSANETPTSAPSNATAMNGARVTGTATALPQPQTSPMPNYGGIIFAHGAHPAAAFYKINPDGTNMITLNDLGSISVRYPSVSRDTGMIAFSNIFSVNFHSEDLFVMNGDGSGIRRLTSPPDFVRNFNPSISPDGTEIAFISDEKRGTPFYTCHNGGTLQELNEVFVMNTDGTRLRQVTHAENALVDTTVPGNNTIGICATGENYFVAWTPDSQSLVIATQRPADLAGANGSPKTLLNAVVAGASLVDGTGGTTLYGFDDNTQNSLPSDNPLKNVPNLPIFAHAWLDVAANGKILFRTNADGWNGSTGPDGNSLGTWVPGSDPVRILESSLMGADGQIGDARLSPDGSKFLIYGHRPSVANNLNTLFINDPAAPVTFYAIPTLDNGFTNVNSGIAWAPGPPIPQPAQLVITPNPVLSYNTQRTPVTPTLLDAQGNVIARTAQWTNIFPDYQYVGFRCDGTTDQVPCSGYSGRNATIDFTGAVVGSGNEGTDNLCEENAGLRACVPHYNTAGYAFLSVSATTPIANASGAGGPGVFTIRREGNPPTQDPLLVNFSVSGTATRDLDYTFDFSGNTITLPAGQASVDIHVRPLRPQPLDKTVVLTLQPDSGTSYSLYAGGTTATVTIHDDSGPRSCVTAPSGMVGWWAGDGNTNDVLAANNGIPEGNLSFSTGMVGQAFTFDGTTADVKIPASGALDVGTGNGMTIDAWINPSDLSMRPLVEWDSSSALGAHFWMSVNGFGPAGSLFGNLFDTSGNSHLVYTTSSVLNANSYQHVALTYDRTNGNVAIYVNGAPVSTNTTNLGIFTPQTSYDLYLGARAFPNNPRYSGQMDEVELFNHALSGTEIAAIYNAGTAGKCKPGASPSPTPTPTPTLSLSYITPNHGGDGGSVTATVYGLNIQQGASLRLVRTGEPDILGSSATVGANGFSITALLNLSGRAQGQWDVIVTNPSNQVATMPAAFTIAANKEAKVWADFVGRYSLRSGLTERFYVAYGNTGNVDADSTVVQLYVPKPLSVRPAARLADGTRPFVVSGDTESRLVFYVPTVPANSTYLVPVDLTTTPDIAHQFFTVRVSALSARSFATTTTLQPDANVSLSSETILSTADDSKIVVHVTDPLGGGDISYELTKAPASGPADPIVQVTETTTDIQYQVQITVPAGSVSLAKVASISPNLVASAFNRVAQNDSTKKLHHANFASRPASADSLGVWEVVSGVFSFGKKTKSAYDSSKKAFDVGQAAIDGITRKDLIDCLFAHGIIDTTQQQALTNYSDAKVLATIGGTVASGQFANAMTLMSGALDAAFIKAFRDAIRYSPNIDSIFRNRIAQFDLVPFTDQIGRDQINELIIRHALELCLPPTQLDGKNKTAESRGAYDPNDKFGPQGGGDQHYISGSEPSGYAIFFENRPDAGAPAQTVTVTDQLDASKLDLSTFSLGGFSFGNNVVAVPAGLFSYTTDVDLRPGANLIVRISAQLDQGTGLLTAQFRSLDPLTMQTVSNPLAGFLPPNVMSPEGQGSVVFSVQPKSQLADGSQIRNHARIIFDANTPIDTPEWLNTIDNSKPLSNVTSATQVTCANDLNVQWAGTDGGSGIGTYTIFVSDNGGPFNEWLTNTTSTSATYSGTVGHTYGFYSVARDNAGNTEDPHATADATVTLNANTPPTLTYSNKSLSLGSATSINPSSGPSDNGSVASIALLNQGAYTGGISVNNSTGVISLTNAAPAGTHTLTVRATDNCGLTTHTTVQVTVVNTAPTISGVGVTRSAGAPTASATIANVNDAEQAKNTLTVAVNNGASATVNNVSVSGLSINAAGVVTASVATPCNASTANFTLKVTDNGGLSNSTTLTVTVIPPPGAPTAGSNSPVLVGGTLNLNASTIAGANYSWTGPNAFTSNQQNPSITSVTLAATGTYYVTASINGCPSPAGTATVAVSQPPPPPTDKIVFESVRNGNEDIYAMNADGTSQTRLTTNAAADDDPAWSPDHSKIAFVSTRDGNQEIYVMNADGSSQARLTNNPAIDGDPSWSPDGTKIVFWSSRNGNPEIYVMNANGSNVTRLTNNPAADIQPKWSPDGSRIVFTSNRDGLLNAEIYVMNANGTNVVRLTNDRAIEESPSFSPDGTKILFDSNRGGLLDFEVWVMNANGTNPVRLTNGPRASARPAWSRDGSKIVFATNRDNLLLFEIYSMNANGSSLKRLTDNSFPDFAPNW